jgi:hypothetical protein
MSVPGQDLSDCKNYVGQQSLDWLVCGDRTAFFMMCIFHFWIDRLKDSHLLTSNILTTPGIYTKGWMIGLSWLGCWSCSDDSHASCVCSVVQWMWYPACYSNTNNQICRMCTSPTHQIVSPTLCDQCGQAQREAGRLNRIDLLDPDPCHTTRQVTCRRYSVQIR